MSIQCEICLGSNTHILGKVNSFDILNCRDCGAMYALNRPDIKELELLYKDAKFDKWKRGKSIIEIYDNFNNKPSAKKDFFKMVLAKTVAISGKDSLSVLEVGAAKGLFIDYCVKQGHNAVGTEASREVVEFVNGFCPGYLRFVENNNYRDTFSDRKFDLIYAEHVFEHLPSPAEILEQLHSILNPGGIIFLAVPNHGSYSARKQGLKGDNVTPPVHLFYYTRSSLSKLLERKGFEIKETFFMNSYHTTVWNFYTMDKFLNWFIIYGNRILRTNIKRLIATTDYPRGIKDKIRLLPYSLYRLKKQFVKTDPANGFEDELLVFAQKIK